MVWTDCRLKWNETEHGGLTYVMVPYATVWTPDITLYDNAADEEMMPGKENYKAVIFSDGSVSYDFPTVLKSTCRINAAYFPFDTQKCTFTFGSWSHHGFELDLVIDSDEMGGDLYNFVEHNEWRVIGFPAERHVIVYNCCPEPYPDITYYLTFQRKPHFYILTTLFPCILVNLVAVFSFILPVESGEKISLGVGVLLTIAFFMSIVNEKLPASSNKFPYVVVAVYYAASMTLVTLSCVASALVLNIYYRGNNGRQVPKWIKYIVLDKLGYLLWSQEREKQRRNNSTNFKPNPGNIEDIKIGRSTNEKREIEENSLINGDMSVQTEDPVFASLKFQTAILNKLHGKSGKDIDFEQNMAEWQKVAFIMDRFFLFLFVLLTILISSIFIGVMASDPL